jgi:hypothetical protein
MGGNNLNVTVTPQRFCGTAKCVDLHIPAFALGMETWQEFKPDCGAAMEGILECNWLGCRHGRVVCKT